MVSFGDALQLMCAGVVTLITLSSVIAWLPARSHCPDCLSGRLFIGIGTIALILDPGGVGVLGAILAAMGIAIWWAGQPVPEIPRPRQQGLLITSLIAGLVTLMALRGWGPLGDIPEQARIVVAPFVAAVGALGTLAVADRARVTYRDELRRRLRHPSAVHEYRS
ncbi:hypothetical protein EF847_08945 [Actinobacteria bacterium YIM 96077]|uniref:Uncharacterized protein n=1 Tax=Phytoactinopolyspora halophila TaxID=1981511 RepID=A0A329QVN0_9ACTN|nr:hypothetical protein [Phytoactinopolyspora halophila]AYY12820.1 hypothetical protein EF847_08945 [Actinobacteria bacterium YIM 96077]RAW16387.1 hypothetical protein DPM12_07075 [Phytoactinopolyspora halophila]